MPGAFYDLISDQLLTVTGTVTFSNIPTTYKHLELVIAARTKAANERTLLTLNFNTDSGANYTVGHLGLAGSTAMDTSFTAAGVGIDIGYLAGGACATAAGAIQCTVFNPGSTLFHKSVLSQNILGNSTSPGLALFGGAWRSTAPATQIRLGNAVVFASGSRFTLYGMR